MRRGIGGGGPRAIRAAPVALVSAGISLALVMAALDRASNSVDSAARGETAVPTTGSPAPEPMDSPAPTTTHAPAPETTGATAVATTTPKPAPSTPRPVDLPRDRSTGFRQSSRGIHPIPDGWWPYQDGIVRPVPFGLVDEHGVRMFQLDDDPTIWDHPIAQAQYALRALESYRLTGEGRYVDVAVANAERIVSRAFQLDGAWYFPYDFTFDLYRNGRGVLRAPWSSGMASGQALSLFARLYSATGDEVWRDHADRTFKAFLQAPDGEGYFSSWVDDDGLLWLEEYSRYPVGTSERVLNGHMWSMFGLWDYWRITDRGTADVEKLWRGALYTVEQTAMSRFRREGGVSLYSLWQSRPAYTYHEHHQRQFLILWRMTHDPTWVARAFAYRDDYPDWRDTEGLAVVTPEVTQMYRLDDAAHHMQDRSMTILETKAVSFTEVSETGYDRRGQMADGRPAIRLSTGPHVGWWIPEQYGVAWSREPVERHDYLPAVVLTAEQPLRAAVYTYDDAGTRSGHRFVELQPRGSYPAIASAIVEGRPAWLLTGPDLEGYWLPQQPGLTIAGVPADTF